MPRKKPDVKLYPVESRLPEKAYLALLERAVENERSIAAELRVAVRKHLRQAA